MKDATSRDHQMRCKRCEENVREYGVKCLVDKNNCDATVFGDRIIQVTRLLVAGRRICTAKVE